MNKIEPRGYIVGTVIFTVSFVLAQLFESWEMGVMSAIAIAANFIVNAIKENTEAIRDLPVRDDEDRY